MPSLQDAVKEAASVLKDIKIKKGYKEEPIPWKRLIIAIAISATATTIIIIAAVTIIHDSAIPALSNEELSDMMRSIEGRTWYCNAENRKKLRDDFNLSTDGYLTAYREGSSMLYLNSGKEVIPVSPDNGYLRGYIGRLGFTVYLQEGNTPSESCLVLISDENSSVIFTP